MLGIPVYDTNTEDYTNNGLGFIMPSECTLTKAEMTIIHPIDNEKRWSLLQIGRVIKAPAPVRESPLIEIEQEQQTGQTEIYEVYGSSHGTKMRNKASSSGKSIETFENGSLMVKLATGHTSSWMHVTALNGGQVGFMPVSHLRLYERIPPQDTKITVKQSREQLYRIYSIEIDTEQETVTARAMHIFYDLRGNPLKAEFAVDKADAATTANAAWGLLLNETDFTFTTYKITGTVTGDYSFKSFPEILLDPDEGIAAQCGGIVILDNYDIFLIPNDVRDNGVTIRRGKNLTGVLVNTDASEICTRVIPTGQNKDGDTLMLTPTIYVDSPIIDSYPEIMAKRIEYDVKVDSSSDSEYKTDAQARAELRRRAELEFSENGIDKPTYGMEVNFVLLQDTEDYPDYARLQAVHLYDTVTVIDEVVGISEQLQATDHIWNVLTEQYDSITLGDLNDQTSTVYGYNIADGSVKGSKISPGAISSGQLDSRFLSAMIAQYAPGATLTTGNMNASSINWDAVTALQTSINSAIERYLGGV